LVEYKIGNNTISFKFQKPAEFMFAMSSIVIGEEFVEYCKNVYDITIEREWIDYIHRIQSNLSSFIKSELEYFFPIYSDLGLDIFMTAGMIIYRSLLVVNTEVEDVEEFIKIIEKADKNIIFLNLLANYLYEYEDKIIDEIYNLDEIRNDTEKMLEIIKAINFENEEMKKRIVDYFENPEETKLRYVLMLKSVYIKGYKEIENEIGKRIEPFLESYVAQFEKEPSKFYKDYLKADLGFFGEVTNIHISYFYYMGTYGTRDLLSSSDYFVGLGIYTDRLFKEDIQSIESYKFLKTISDKTRMKIIRLLSTRPWYVNELAEELGLSAASISYHVSMLTMLNIVTLEKSNQKAYYSLNKDRLNELFEEAKGIILNE